MDKQYIDNEFNSFFEFPTEDRSQVSSVSCKLFAEHIAYPLEQQAERLRAEVKQKNDLYACALRVVNERDRDLAAARDSAVMETNNAKYWKDAHDEVCAGLFELEEKRKQLIKDLAAAREEIERLKNGAVQEAYEHGKTVMLEQVIKQRRELAAHQLVIQRMASALNRCADKFHDYAEIHAQKEQTPDNEMKVERNLEMAKDCDQALALQPNQEALEAYVKEAVEKEREECAKVADSQPVANGIAERIRARKEKQ